MPFKGAQYRKADLQLHSPRDHGWEGDRPQVIGGDVKSARLKWAKSFVEECSARGLRVVALTDHHEGVYIWPVLEALAHTEAADQEHDLWILPAMELTAKDSAQAIVLFDQDIGEALFSKARNLLRLPADCLITTDAECNGNAAL